MKNFNLYDDDNWSLQLNLTDLCQQVKALYARMILALRVS